MSHVGLNEINPCSSGLPFSVSIDPRENAFTIWQGKFTCNCCPLLGKTRRTLTCWSMGFLLLQIYRRVQSPLVHLFHMPDGQYWYFAQWGSFKYYYLLPLFAQPQGVFKNPASKRIIKADEP